MSLRLRSRSSQPFHQSLRSSVTLQAIALVRFDESDIVAPALAILAIGKRSQIFIRVRFPVAILSTNGTLLFLLSSSCASGQSVVYFCIAVSCSTRCEIERLQQAYFPALSERNFRFATLGMLNSAAKATCPSRCARDNCPVLLTLLSIERAGQCHDLNMHSGWRTVDTRAFNTWAPD